MIELDSPAFKLLNSAGTTDGSWSLFDLRPLRSGSRKLAAGDIELFNLINGYDFALIIPRRQCFGAARDAVEALASCEQDRR